MSMWKRFSLRRAIPVMAGAGLLSGLVSPAAEAAPLRFSMVRSSVAVAADCLRNASARVTVTPQGQVERLDIRATKLPPNTEFDVFVTQVPNAPFGLSWYQGDLESNAAGEATVSFLGRFNIETFIVAPGVDQAPVVHHGTIADASTNPATAPVHTFHLGIWFNSPADAARAGCPNTLTPFNGEHNAGVQALSTRNFGKLQGPLRRLDP